MERITKDKSVILSEAQPSKTRHQQQSVILSEAQPARPDTNSNLSS
jgi:hypothetical protein